MVAEPWVDVEPDLPPAQTADLVGLNFGHFSSSQQTCLGLWGAVVIGIVLLWPLGL